MNRMGFRERKRERGVTIVLIAIALVALLAMAALAIDITTLYVARGEAQRAANAAALAGAKMFVTSGVTSGFTAQSDVCEDSGPGSTKAANRQAEAVAAQNQVVGQPGAVLSITCDFTQPLDPRITVVVQRTSLPTFFARIWGGAANTVSATAVAEAYNPSGLNTPIQVENVKPWLVPNCDPTTGAIGPCPGSPYFINPVDGSIAGGGAFIGRKIIFNRIMLGYPGSKSPVPPALSEAKFYAMNVPINLPVASCPSTSAVECGQVGANDFRDNIACASKYPLNCGQNVGDLPPVTVTIADGYGQMTREGARCLIHADAEDLGNGQDVFSTPNGPGTPPIVITAGDNNPNPTFAAANTPNISRSDSIVTVPLYDGTDLCTGPSNFECVTGLFRPIVGFLQLGITRTISGPPRHFEGIVLNAVGCTPGASGNPVTGGGVSLIPVRLIHQ